MSGRRLFLSDSYCYLVGDGQCLALDPQRPEQANMMVRPGTALTLVLDALAEDTFVETLPAGVSRRQRRQIRRATQARLTQLYPEALVRVSDCASGHLLCSVLEPDSRLRQLRAWLAERRCRIKAVVALGSLAPAHEPEGRRLLQLDCHDGAACRFRLYDGRMLVHQRAVPLTQSPPWPEIYSALRETVSYFRQSAVLGEDRPGLLYTGAVHGGSALLTHLRDRYAMTVHRTGQLPDYLNHLPQPARGTTRYLLPRAWQSERQACIADYVLPRALAAFCALLLAALLFNLTYYHDLKTALSLLQSRPPQSSTQAGGAYEDPAALLAFWERLARTAEQPLIMELGYMLARQPAFSLRHVQWRGAQAQQAPRLEAELMLSGVGADEAGDYSQKLQAWLETHFQGNASLSPVTRGSEKLSGVVGEGQRPLLAQERRWRLILEHADVD
ncbi:hypothetical protein Q4485_11505 [Granulosicoccaceae sp. 1_MG-2023]|nr:hypothetical protein [Granulosicoccaceae sp. 1_MG-2023]